jgi:hypothetical protein
MNQLNDTNGASDITFKYSEICKSKFSENLNGVEMGIAYGGGIERIGKSWKNRGTIWGFDTFEGHPKEIAKSCKYTMEVTTPDKEAHATYCMDPWYNDPNYGTEKFKYEYIRENLDSQQLDNVVLVKGLITEDTDISFIEGDIHYALIDLDFPISQWVGWNLLKNKIAKGGYLCLHDMIPYGHIHGNYEYYQQMVSENLFDVVEEVPQSYLVVLQKK